MKASIRGWMPEAVEGHSFDDRVQRVGCVANWTADALGQTTPAGG
ncbi:MAG: hypothetical protein QW801_04745 [Candidatus Caldarchaeum sp.]